MADLLPLSQEEYFDKVSHQGKTIKVGDKVVVREAGEEKTVEVTSIIKKQGHFWVGYEANQHSYPWPLVRLALKEE
ncbi:MAG: hypothetical protein KJ077_27195 [Anaerolineae bacterium]|nr:hypothetical protein [Anaerolineae bacterium]